MRRAAAPFTSRSLSWFLLLGSLALIGWFVHQHRADFSAIGKLAPRHAVGLVAIQAAFILLQIERTRLLLKKVSGRELRLLPWFRLFIIGSLLNLFVPQAAVAYRGVNLKRQFGIGYTAFATALFLLLWFTNVMGLGLATAVLVAVYPTLRVGGVPIVPLLALVTILLALSPFFVRGLVRPIRSKAGISQRFVARLHQIANVAIDNLRDPAFAFWMILLTLLTIVDQIALLLVGLAGLGLPPKAESAVVLYALHQASTVVMLTPGNFGVQELAFGIVGKGLGMSLADGVLLSALVRVSAYVILLPAGAFLVISRRRPGGSGSRDDRPIGGEFGGYSEEEAI